MLGPRLFVALFNTSPSTPTANTTPTSATASSYSSSSSRFYANPIQKVSFQNVEVKQLWLLFDLAYQLI